LTGTGSLTAVQSAATVAALSGSGSLTAVNAPKQTFTETLSGSGTLTSVASSKASEVLSGSGLLTASARFPTTVATNTIFLSTGLQTYSIPYWCNKLDIVTLGGGGAGYNGQGGFNNGGGGGAGSFASTTYTRGTDIGWDKTTIPLYVGAGGTSVVPRASCTNGGYSSILPEYGTTGPGAFTASGTGTISATWTHTPTSSDDYVIVCLTLNAGVSRTTLTKTVTYGGTAMSLLGNGLHSGNNSLNPFVEMYVLAITPGSGPKTVSVTATLSGTSFTNLKANSISLTGIGTFYPETAAYGASTAPANYGIYGGQLYVGAMIASTSTFSSYAASVTSRYSSNTSPSAFVMTADSLASTSGYYTYTAGTLAASSAWAAIGISLFNTDAFANGGVAGANQGTTEQGSSPGGITYNGINTYIGGAVAGTNNNATGVVGNEPGGGGSGTNGPLIGAGNVGGNGAMGRVWVRAYQ